MKHGTFADTVLIVTMHKSYPALPPEALSGPAKTRAITYRRIKVPPRDLTDVSLPVIFGPPPGPPGFGKVVLTCQNLGVETEHSVRFGITFSAVGCIHHVNVDDARVTRLDDESDSRRVEFGVQALRSNEKVMAEIVARNDAVFDAHLWKDDQESSSDIFIYDVIIGDAEPRGKVRSQPKVGRNDPCPCGSGKKFKHCHGSAADT
jgi:hypothetical protein